MSCEMTAPDGVDSLFTVAEAAEQCGVTEITIRAWANRGYLDRNGNRQKLERAGRDRRGRNVYRYLDVAKAEFATRERARREHRVRVVR